MYTLYNQVKFQSKRPMIYLASPYSCGPNGEYAAADTGLADNKIKHQRFVEACHAAGSLMNKYTVISPIAHSHAVERFGMVKDQTGDFWLDQDLEIVARCDKVVVLMLEGWEHSRGIKREVEFAKNNNIPVEYITYNDAVRTQREAETT